MRSIRCIPVHQNNRTAFINHAIFPNPGAGGAGGGRVTNAWAGGSCHSGAGLPWARVRGGGAGVRTYNSAVADAEGGAFELGTDGPKVILVGVDDSVTSMRAGAYAAGLARRQGARLVCVYVERPSAMYGAAAG